MEIVCLRCFVLPRTAAPVQAYPHRTGPAARSPCRAPPRLACISSSCQSYPRRIWPRRCSPRLRCLAGPLAALPIPAMPCPSCDSYPRRSAPLRWRRLLNSLPAMLLLSVALRSRPRRCVAFHTCRAATGLAAPSPILPLPALPADRRQALPLQYARSLGSPYLRFPCLPRRCFARHAMPFLPSHIVPSRARTRHTKTLLACRESSST